METNRSLSQYTLAAWQQRMATALGKKSGVEKPPLRYDEMDDFTKSLYKAFDGAVDFYTVNAVHTPMVLVVVKPHKSLIPTCVYRVDRSKKTIAVEIGSFRISYSRNRRRAWGMGVNIGIVKQARSVARRTIINFTCVEEQELACCVMDSSILTSNVRERVTIDGVAYKATLVNKAKNKLKWYGSDGEELIRLIYTAPDLRRVDLTPLSVVFDEWKTIHSKIEAFELSKPKDSGFVYVVYKYKNIDGIYVRKVDEWYANRISPAKKYQSVEDVPGVVKEKIAVLNAIGKCGTEEMDRSVGINIQLSSDIEDVLEAAYVFRLPDDLM